MWFDSWSEIVRVLAVGTAAYLTLLVLLRLSGKRTLAELDAFDWVVSVALGSTLATILLGSDVTWSEGVTALALLTALQFAVVWTTTRLPRGRSVVTTRPTLLLLDGEPLTESLTRQRMTMSELRQAVRASGSGTLTAVSAVMLETDGSLSVIPAGTVGDRSALEGVAGFDSSSDASTTERDR
jgi:uncharacterized membrane protein YcaP (DUF421 family)